MSELRRLIPSSSQTVGPYFRIGLEHLIRRGGQVVGEEAGEITLRGRVLDRDRAPVSDAMLEFWYAGEGPDNRAAADFPEGFRRVATDVDGSFSLVVNRPLRAPFDEQTTQAPHMMVLMFARGLLRHLISRVYFEGETANSSDPVLLGIATERRQTLVAQHESERSYRWDVILQGSDETVFFAW